MLKSHLFNKSFCPFCLPSSRQTRNSKALAKDESIQTKIHESSQNRSLSSTFSEFVRSDTYARLRLKDVDNDEFLNWNESLINLVKSQQTYSQDVWPYVETAIQRGVPDILKHDVMLLAHGAMKLMKEHPSLYADKLRHTFGDHIPETFSSQLPTFSGGFLGIEEEILGSPIDVEQLEVDIDVTNRSEVSWTDISSAATSRHNSSFSAADPYLSLADLINPAGSLSEYTGRKALTSRDSHDLENMLNYESYKVDTHSQSRKLAKRNKQWRTLPEGSPSSAPSMSFTKATSLHGTHSQPQVQFKLDENKINLTPPNVIISSPSSDFSEYRLAYEPTREHCNRSLPFSKRFNSNDPETSSDEQFSDEESPRDVYKLESVTHLQKLLNRNGLTAAKRLLWCLSSSYNDIEFCPLIPNLLCVILIFLNEKETFYLLSVLLNLAHSRARSGEDRPFLTYRRSDFVRYVKLVETIAFRHFSKVTHHLSKLGIDVAAWLAKHLSDGLARAVPFNMLLRIYIAFLFEGVRIFQRYILAILKVNSKKLLCCTTKSQAEDILRGSKRGTVSNMNILTKTAFQLSSSLTSDSINKFSSHDLPTPYLTGVRLQRFYRPRLTQRSIIVDDSEWEIIWSWIPHNSRILDPHICWRSNKDGASMRALDRKCSPHHGRPMLFLISVSSGEILGGYFPKHFTLSKAEMNVVDPGESLLFTLRPETAVFFWSGANAMFVDYTPNAILIGGNEVALWIDSDIHRGYSRSSESYDSPQLAGDIHGDFIIRFMEIWTLL